VPEEDRVGRLGHRPSVLVVGAGQTRLLLASELRRCGARVLPAEGHGMNGALQDAFNLAWKLALVHRGAADPACSIATRPSRPMP
jgi:FAD binding domain